MGVCFSKKDGETPSPTKVPSNDLSKHKCAAKEEKKKSEVTEKQPQPPSAIAVVAPSLSARKASCVGEERENKKAEIPMKKCPQFEEERGSKAPVNIEIPGEQLTAPLRTSSCTKEEIESILIQCGRLSRSSSGKTSKETVGIGENRRYSGSKRSYDFDDERRGEEADQDKPVSRPSPRRRTPNRERSGSRERRVSRSPGRRADGPGFTATVSDKQKAQPAKMISVPAREKGAPFVNGETGSGNFATKRVTASPRSRSPANTTRISNENPQPQSLSRNSSRKTDQSPCRRNPLIDVEDNSLKNQNGSTTSTFQKSRAIDEAVKKQNQDSKQIQKEKQDTMKDVNQITDAKKANNGAENPNNPRTLTRTRSSRRSSRDLDNNPVFNPTTSYASLLLEDIQTQQQQQQQNTAFSLPACISKACSILDAVADLNSACSDRRSYEAEKSSTNNINRNGGFMARGLLAKREQLIESELEVKDELMKPCLHKYVTVRQMGMETEPQESAGSNSFGGMPWTSSLWDMNSVDSTCGTSLTGNWKEVEDEVRDGGNRQHRSSCQRSGAASGRTSPMGKKREFDQQLVQQVGGGNGKVGGRAFSLPVSAATF